jgi:hypothetical protein
MVSGLRVVLKVRVRVLEVLSLSGYRTSPALIIFIYLCL